MSAFDVVNSVEDQPNRFLVGIDLGTTNSAICSIDLSAETEQVQTFSVPQLIAPGEVEALETLPSFCYLPSENEFPTGSLRMPWEPASSQADAKSSSRQIVGIFAREQGKLVPGRVIESAKSWLCHSGVDRTSALLPWRGAEDVPRLSPVEVSSAYLSQMRLAWNHAHPQFPLEQQDVVITIPASFDEVARELTVEAAKRAGLPRVMLIEEPQAAFYSWLHQHSDHWQELVQPGQNILVCDIGGGTTDFTLIRVREHATEQVQFHRVAVGDHLILGGDNLDLALAHHLEPRFSNGGRLDPRQWGSLVRVCRQVKEILFSETPPETATVTIPGSGSRLVGGARSVEVSRDEVLKVLLEGFFPKVPLTERPQKQRSGFQEFGLPYAADPAVTKHLALFLENHLSDSSAVAGGSTRPDIILFNGGAFLSPQIQNRILEVIRDWYCGDDADWKPIVLENKRHDLAVAQGAAYYGLVRRGKGVRIAAGLPRTYYIGVAGKTDAASSAEVAMQALCLMPAGTEPGTTVSLPDRVFSLTVAAPVEFPLFHSSLRLTDAPGTLIPIEREQLTPLPPIRTVLRFGKEKQAATLNVQLHSRLTEIGTLQVWCSEVGGSRTWQLQFDIRSATQTDLEGHAGAGEAAGVFDEQSVERVRQILVETFDSKPGQKPGGLPKRISEQLEMSREDWPPALLRQIWEMLIQLEHGRNRSAEHEARWLNLLGFSLRPGYGLALDDWRVAETWKRLRGRLVHPGATTMNEWWILWRRVGGGLTGGQQQALATPLMTSLRDEQRRARAAKGSKKTAAGQDTSETWRLLGSLERLPASWKHELGSLALELLNSESSSKIESALLWTLGRIGARQPLYGSLNDVVEPHVAEVWLKQIIQNRSPTSQHFLAAMQLARRTGDRYRDLPDEARQKCLRWLEVHSAPDAYVQLIREGGELASETTSLIFGESLPVGLRMN